MAMNLSKRSIRCAAVWTLLLAWLAGPVARAATLPAPAAGARLAVLVPDGSDLGDPRLTIWADAAWEEGLQLTFLTDSELLALGSGAAQFPGIILPDEVHTRASDALVSALRTYASAGGWLMLVYDFGALTDGGFYAAPTSRLSDLAGIDYLFYDALRDQTAGLGPISGQGSTLRSLQVPPGKSIPAATSATRVLATTQLVAPAAAQTESGSSSSALGARVGNLFRHLWGPHPARPGPALDGAFLPIDPTNPSGLRFYRHHAQFPATRRATALTGPGASALAAAPPAAPASPSGSALETISGYVYGALTYPTWVTAALSSYSGTALLQSTYGYSASTGQLTGAGLAAGLRAYGSGGVLFVNLPLAYLGGETDGMLLHGFLRYFGTSVLRLPRLLDQPSGRGGLVFNWHFDAAEALDPIATLDRQGVWNQGPFSIHWTAGPDTERIGDAEGLNVQGNATTQKWIRDLAAKGHQIGSHGGWDHDLFGLNATETNANQLVPGSTTDTFLDFLIFNRAALMTVLNRPITEYSAPNGNTPIWSLDWLQANGALGYYFTGHTGTGPTRAYRPDSDPAVGRMLHPAMWAFPVTPFGIDATFEEFQTHGTSNAQITAWYSALLDFVVANRTARLIYAHPPGAVVYPDVLNALFSRARQLSLAGRFHWYTMTELAQFEARRLQATWVESGSGTARQFEARHPTDLSGLTWLLPASGYARPAVVGGTGTVSSDGTSWVVTATGGTSLSFATTRLR